MGKECGAWVSRRLWGGGNTSPLKTTAWEAIKEWSPDEHTKSPKGSKHGNMSKF